jgi:hypothetical protein
MLIGAVVIWKVLGWVFGDDRDKHAEEGERDEKTGAPLYTNPGG